MTTGYSNFSLSSLPALSDLINATPCHTLNAGQTLFRPGDPCHSLPVLESGSVRVYARGQGKRQVTLYRLETGALCTISLATLLHNGQYPAEAVAETPVSLHYLPAGLLKERLGHEPELFEVVLRLFAGSLHDSIRLARQLVFEPLDVRLAQLLSEQFRCSPDNSVQLTHSEIANELGTTRVVASRILKKLEHRDCIKLQRRKISLVDDRALQKLIHNGQHNNTTA